MSSTNSLTFENVIAAVLDARAAEIHTALPAKIINYDSAKQVADVQPLVKDVYTDANGDLQTRSFPVLPSVPVAFLRGGGYFVSLPLVAGDTGMLIFCELPIDRWRSTGQEAHPVNARRHGVGNAVFYPGVAPRAKALSEAGMTDGMLLGKEGGAQAQITSSDVVLGSVSATERPPIDSKLQTELSRIRSDFTALVSAIKTALTAGGAPGTGFAGGSTMASAMVFTPSSPGATAATKVKIV